MASSLFASEQQRSPFGVQVVSKPGTSNQVVEVKFTVPSDCVLYSERIHFLTGDDDELTPSKIPDPLLEMDKVTGKQKKVYEQNFNVELLMASLADNRLMVKFQGCSNDSCFFPEKRTFVLDTNSAAKMFVEISAPATPAAPSPADSDWARQLNGFKIAARQSGYLPSKSFLSFLDRAESGNDSADDPLARFQQAGLLVTLLLILVGGVLLNLTPCILPMIPINLAIIGAGTAASSRIVGFKNGGIYGAGMALAYGLLGLAVVLTGAKFGSINSSVWFNVVIAVVFVALALAMFDKINIDFSRFSNVGPQKANASRGALIHHIVIFVMGAMAALLAGACVAPVVISVMLLAASFYAKKNIAGLLLPFLLGAGMALPWPLAGAGLTFLPKPGVWMNRVKHSFGVLILLFAIYYAHEAVNAFQARQDTFTSLASAPENASVTRDDANLELARALQSARRDGRPVLVDFHASWCKNCLAMDETVFRKNEVKQRLQDFILVRYDAERPGEYPAKEVLDHFGVLGLPSYIVLTAEKNRSPNGQ